MLTTLLTTIAANNMLTLNSHTHTNGLPMLIIFLVSHCVQLVLIHRITEWLSESLEASSYHHSN